MAAAVALAKVSDEAEESVSLLCRFLGAPEMHVRAQASKSLAKIGPPARAAVPSIEAALADPEWAVRRDAATALGAIGDARATDSLRRIASDPVQDVRAAVEAALARLTRPAAPAAALLE